MITALQAAKHNDMDDLRAARAALLRVQASLAQPEAEKARIGTVIAVIEDVYARLNNNFHVEPRT